MNTVSRKSLISLAGALALMATAAIAQANTLYVPSQYFRLQAAIDAAHPGDTIIVAAGTYNDYNLYSPTVWIGKDLTIKGAGPGKTILLSNGEERCLTTQNLTSASSISGFTFENGAQAGGAGMLNTNCSLTINNCEFAYNQAAVGGGMFNDGGNPRISNCTFHNNVAISNGGGMYNNNDSPTVTNCTFTANTAGVYGGGMNNTGGNPTVTNCTFQNHQATAGGGMANQTSNPKVTNCIFLNNMAFAAGGGMHYDFTSQVYVTNCTLVGNSVVQNPPVDQYGAGQGGGIYSDEKPGYGTNYAIVYNCILWGNTAVGSGPATYGSSGFYFSDVQGLPSSTDANGNFGANPLFVNAAGNNLRLQATSPCRDRGNSSVLRASGYAFLSIQGTVVDMDLCRRLSGPAVDLGAYEFQSVTDVSSMIKVTVNPPTYNNGSYFQILIVTNTGGINLNGPVTLVLNGLKGYVLQNGSGVTSALAPAGRPYMNVAASLLPGQSVRVFLQFLQTGSGMLSYTTQVYDGIGTR